MRYPTLVLWFALIALISSCNKEQETDKIKIGFSQCTSNSNWRKSMNYSMKVQASVHSNVDLSIYDGNDNPENQIHDIERLIEEGIDILIVSPLEPNLIVEVLEKAENKGIPIILLDRKANLNNYTAYLGADNIKVGRNAGKFMASSGKGNINVIEVKGGDESTPSLERSLGFHQILNNNPQIHLIQSLDIDEAGFPKEVFARLLDSLGGQRIDYVYCYNDDMALEGWEVAKDMGFENDIKFVGVDGLDGPNGGIQMVQDGVLDATILYPTGGAEVIKLALQILNGEKVPKNTLLNTIVIDKFNAGIMQDQLNRVNQQQIEIENQVSTILKQEELYASQNFLLKASVAFLVIILSLAVYSVYSIIAIRKKNRQLEIINSKITVQRNQIEKIANQVKISNEEKLNFFTGISHEFKTPITLILSAIESIGEVVKEKGVKLGNELELIHNNSNRLLRLINQLLDFRKNEDRKFKLRASKTNLYSFSATIMNDFMKEARKRNIDFRLKSSNKDISVYMDRNLMEKVYFNLLSNAFKFTPDNGKIEIQIIDEVERKQVSVVFKDSGIGIPKQELENVFQVFFKGSNNRTKSSGMGLHLSKEFMELHKGSIRVSSLKGTEFTIKIPKGTEHLEPGQIIEDEEIIRSKIIDFEPDLSQEVTSLAVEPDNAEKYSVLIIEDDKDLSLFLFNKLMKEYHVEISDGSDAVEKAFQSIPDIIICDLNLVDIDGFEISNQLKKDLRTSHIPIVILTALSNKESYVKGLQCGADLYLTKPFSYSILIQSIRSLLYNRENLRYYYTNNIYKIDEIESFGDLEQGFLCDLNKLIEDNIDKEDFSVEDLAHHLRISRSQLYRKVKAILGISISDYITQFRLERAKSMLVKSNLSVSEIAYKNGFSSPNYFSTAFKGKYGSSPVYFRKSMAS
ncbi:substrate-binding domain-containing protein [Zunongwangia sp. H14]|uniref:substrate-binding domain-containing protein n=1 Tax=Zunongwangia sp. H14 TaxID=3240792 RepID=UPI0035626292